MKLNWYWTIHHIPNQPNLCWITFFKAHIIPSLNPWIPFNGFHFRLMKPWLQNIYGSNLPKVLYTILFIRYPPLDTYSIVHFCWPKSMDNMSLWHIIQACINMALVILTTVFIAHSAAPFWCDALAPLNLIFCWLFNSSCINSEALNIPLSVWYLLITNPWLWASLSKFIFALTVSVAFIATWCLILI